MDTGWWQFAACGLSHLKYVSLLLALSLKALAIKPGGKSSFLAKNVPGPF